MPPWEVWYREAFRLIINLTGEHIIVMTKQNFFLVFLGSIILVLLSACQPDKEATNIDNIADPLPPAAPMGDFRLGHNIVLTNNTQIGPMSREVELVAWELMLGEQINKRLGIKRYNGDGLYHIGVSISGYLLAPPGIPLIASPRSMLVVRVTFWDDKTQKKLNDKPKEFIILDQGLIASSFKGTGLSATVEEQMLELCERAVEKIENWLRQNQTWFTL